MASVASEASAASAFIIGVNGQDGRYLYDLLAVQGYELWGIDRETARGSKDCPWVRPVDITDPEDVRRAVDAFKPGQVYHLAAYHHSSQNAPGGELAELLDHSYQVHVLSLANFLEAIQKYSPRSRLFYAASSHIFGAPPVEPQDEMTAINPHTAYGITKACGVFLCRAYRQKFGLFSSAGILYNHESVYRSEQFVSMKIIRGAVKIKKGLQEQLVLGDLSAEVDWGYAPDYVNAMSRILRLPEADEFIIATGVKHTVQEFVEIAFGCLGLDWQKYVSEQEGILKRSIPQMLGNPQKLMLKTGWKPSVSFREMIAIMVRQVELDG